MVKIQVNRPLGMVLQDRLIFEIMRRALTSMLAKSMLVVLESRVASVGHRRPELLPMRWSPFWQCAGKFSSCSNPKFSAMTQIGTGQRSITWYFQRTLWPRFGSEKQLYIWVPFYHRGFIYSYSTAIVQLFHSLTGPRSPARAVSWASGAGLPIAFNTHLYRSSELDNIDKLSPPPKIGLGRDHTGYYPSITTAHQ